MRVFYFYESEKPTIAIIKSKHRDTQETDTKPRTIIDNGGYW